MTGAAQPVTPAVEDNFDYDAEFEKLTKERAARDPDAEPSNVLDVEPDKEPATPAAGSEPAEPADKSEPAAAGEPAKEPAKEPSAEPAAPDEDALLAEVPQTVREALAARLRAGKEAEERARKAEHDNRSMAGRVSAYQRRYEEATGKRPPSPEPAKPTPEQEAEWKQFVTDYPDIAKAIEVKFAQAQAAAPEGERSRELLQYVEDQRRNQFLADAWAAVDAVHPTWREEAKTKEFQDWKASSPTYGRLASSDDIADAVALFDLYHAHTAKQQPTPTPPPKNDAAATQLAARREAQAEGALSPAGKTVQPNHAVDLNDADQLFAFYADKANTRMRQRNR